MDGLRFVAVADASILILDRVSDEIKDALKSRLSGYCYGRVRAKEDPAYYSYDQTLREFFRLYDSKDQTTRIGIAGELIVHLLLPHGHEKLECAAVYLNKEESSIKKGFDLTFLERDSNALWYGEVKAGQLNDQQTAEVKARDLIGDAERGLNQMFTTDIRKKRWDSAQLDAMQALDSDEADTVGKLLRADFMKADQGAAVQIRALLCAVVMHEIKLSQIGPTLGPTLISSVTSRGRFQSVKLLLIQQATLEDLISVLRHTMKAGK